MKGTFAIAVRRLLAFALDWLVVLLWAGVVFGAVMLVTGGRPPRPANAWTAQGIGLLAMTIPVLLYFALCESSATRASLGKRFLRLEASGTDARRLSFTSSLLRNAVKFAPWELGHTVAHQAIFAGEEAPPTWVWAAAAGAIVVPLWWLIGLIATGRTPYDRWTSTQVTSAPRRAYTAGR